MKILRSRRSKIVFAIVIVLLVALRVALPEIVRRSANAYLAEFSPVWKAHIGDVDLSFLTMNYEVEDVTVSLKEKDRAFLSVDEIAVNIAWRELLRGRILADVVIDEAKMRLTNDVIRAAREAKTPPQEDAAEIKRKYLPLQIERVVVRDSTFQYADLPEVPEPQRWSINDINVRVSNLTPANEDSDTLVTLDATMQDTAVIRAVAKALMRKKPLEWDVDAEMRDFDLVKANPALREILPFSFRSGTLDVFAEAKSENGGLVGYVKPYLTKVDVVGNRGDFQGPKHFLFEVVGALGNVIMRRSSDKTVATKVGFRRVGGEIKVDTEGAVANVIEHGFDERIPKGIEETIQLK